MEGSGMRDMPRYRVGAGDLRASDVPMGPGVYAWFRDEELIYIDAARKLRKRILEIDAQGWQGRGPSPSQFRSRLTTYLRETVGLPEDPDERRVQLDAWISACEVGWVKTPSYHDAQAQVRRLLPAEAPVLNQWRPGPGEDGWLLKYLDLIGGREKAGRVHVEVPFAGAANYGPRAKIRYIDAVRFPDLRPSEVVFYDEATFRADTQAPNLEIIEIKKTLNRAVIGQLVVAQHLAPTDWNLDDDVELEFVALVTEGDPALEAVCARLGIRVVLVERD